MAISGAFAADFTSFNAAVDGAVVKLASMESGSEKVAGRLSRMTESFSGRKIIQEAKLMAEVFERAGNGAGLTAAELQRMGAVGAEAMAKLQATGAPVPPGIARIAAEARTTGGELEHMRGIAASLAGAFGVSFSLGAVVGFGKELLATAGHLVKVSNQTGIFISDVQRLEYVAGQTGGSLDTLTGAIGKMQLNLNDPKAQQAFRDLNINFAELSAKNPYQQFEMIATAVGTIESPVRQAEAAVAIFGRTGLEILPQLKAKFKELASEATTSGDAQVRAVNAAGDALDRQWTRMKNQALGGAGGFAQLVEKMGLADALMATLNPSRYAAEMGKIQVEVDAAAAAEADLAAVQGGVAVDAQDTYRAHLDEVRGAVDALSVSDKAMIKDALALGESTTEIAGGMNLAAGAVEVYATALQKAEAATKQAAEKEKTLVGQQLLELTKIKEDARVLEAAQTGTADERAIVAIKARYAKQIAALEESGKITAAIRQELARNELKEIDDVGALMQQKNQNSISAMRARADHERQAYMDMANSGDFYRDELDKQLALVKSLEAAARGMGAATVKAYAEMAEAAESAFDRTNRARMSSENTTSAYSNQKEMDKATKGMTTFDRTNYERQHGERGKATGDNDSWISTFETAADVWAAHGLTGPVRDALLKAIAERESKQTVAATIDGRSAETTVVNVDMKVSGVLDPRTIQELSAGVSAYVMRSLKVSRQMGTA